MTVGATTTQAYGEPWYWDNRYSRDAGPFDWYQNYVALAPLFNLYLHRNHKILVVGCGNSGRLCSANFCIGDRVEHGRQHSSHLNRQQYIDERSIALGQGMANDGYRDVVNVDISSVVIEAMQKKYREYSELKYFNMDVRDMDGFESGSFDAVIDKGTLDSLMCGHDAQQNATKMLTEVGRVLKDGGVYILITYGAPIYRVSLLRESCLWKMKLHLIGKPATERTLAHKKPEITGPIPLDGDGGQSSSPSVSENPDVHFIYVCIKDDSLRAGV